MVSIKSHTDKCGPHRALDNVGVAKKLGDKRNVRFEASDSEFQKSANHFTSSSFKITSSTCALD